MPMNVSLPDQLFEELGMARSHSNAVALSAHLRFSCCSCTGQRGCFAAMSTFDVVVTVMLGSAGRVILVTRPR